MVLCPRATKLAAPNSGPYLVIAMHPHSYTLRNIATGATFIESTANVRPLVMPPTYAPLIPPVTSILCAGAAHVSIGENVGGTATWQHCHASYSDHTTAAQVYTTSTAGATAGSTVDAAGSAARVAATAGDVPAAGTVAGNTGAAPALDAAAGGMAAGAAAAGATSGDLSATWKQT